MKSHRGPTPAELLLTHSLVSRFILREGQVVGVAFVVSPSVPDWNRDRVTVRSVMQCLGLFMCGSRASEKTRSYKLRYPSS